MLPLYNPVSSVQTCIGSHQKLLHVHNARRTQMLVLQSDTRWTIQLVSVARLLNPVLPGSRPEPLRLIRRSPALLRLRAFYGVETEKPPICTADELHYVPLSDSPWKLALWRYTPPPQAPQRKHPLLLLSGVGTNAIGYDLSPEFSFARHMSSQGFDTWILEVRGAGLSKQRMEHWELQQPINEMPGQINSAVKCEMNGVSTAQLQSVINSGGSLKGKNTDIVTKSVESHLRIKLTQTFTQLFKKLRDFLNKGSFEARQNIGTAGQIRDVSLRLENVQKPLDPGMIYDWDFDNYLEEDLPAAIEYIRTLCKPKDGKLHAIGHSMGGILLYAMLSQYGFKGMDSGLASVITLGSSLDYTSSKSSLKLLMPLADTAEALNVAVLPLGALLTAAYPLASRPPYFLSWLSAQISAQDMMHPVLFERLVLNNFCTIPFKLLLQLRTSLHGGGLRDRSGTFFFKDYLRSSKVPVLAIAGDQDLICPPEAVYDTVKHIPKKLVTYKVFGGPGGPHYGHYDLVGGRLVADEVYPYITKFLSLHDMT